jgi:hypothetical protein
VSAQRSCRVAPPPSPGKRPPPAEIIEVSAKLDAFEQYMHDCGLYSIEDMRPVNEMRMTARWKLGKALKAIGRGHGPGRGKKNHTDSDSFKALLKDLGLQFTTAQAAERIGTLPEKELRSAFAEWKERGELLQPVLKRIRCRPRRYAAHLSDAP